MRSRCKMLEFASFYALRNRGVGLWGLGLHLCSLLGLSLWSMCLSDMGLIPGSFAHG